MVSDTPKVSVILPFYNAENTLEKAILSILNQSFQDFEFLLVNNNSSDASHSIAKKYMSEDSRIDILSEKNQGVVHAANKGMKAAVGEYFARMDADDVSMSNRLLEQVQLLDNEPAVGLLAGKVKYSGDESNEGFIRYVDWSNDITKHDQLYLNQFVEYPIVNPTIMIRKELFQKYGGYEDGYFPEDYEYFLRLISDGVQMKKTKNVVLEWQDSPNRLTRTNDRYVQSAFFKIKAKYLTKWLSQHNPNHPEVVVWGGGKLAKRYSSYLKPFGIRITKIVDVKTAQNSSALYYQDIDAYKDSFILSYVSSRDAREEIREFLNKNGLKEGINYLICA
jgi:glycosyltransferase involved in cell wall biosynthesis